MTVQTTDPWVPTDSFGSRLLRIRKEKGMTVEAIAKTCGIAHPTWTTWENGARPRDLLGAVQKICDGTGVDRDWLLWGSVGSTKSGYAGRMPGDIPTPRTAPDLIAA